MKQITKIYKNHAEFLERENKEENGVSESFVRINPEFEKMNESNRACWNCYGCSDCAVCSGCSGCSDE